MVEAGWERGGGQAEGEVGGQAGEADPGVAGHLGRVGLLLRGAAGAAAELRQPDLGGGRPQPGQVEVERLARPGGGRREGDDGGGDRQRAAHAASRLLERGCDA